MSKRTASDGGVVATRCDAARGLRGGPGLWASRAALIAVCAAVFGVTVVGYAGEWTINVALGAMEDGATVGLWAWICALLGYAVLRWVRVEARGAMGFATGAALGLGVMSLASMGLSLAGWLNRWSAAALPAGAFAVWAIDVVVSRRKIELPIANWLAEPAGWEWLWVLAMPFFGIAVVGASIMPGWLWKPLDPHPYDVMVYHLQVAREWYETGRMIALPHNVYSHFPVAVEMHFLLAMHLRGGPWAAMYLAQFVSLMFMVLSIVSLVGVARQMTGAKAGGVIAGLLAATVPWMTMLGAVAYVEGAFLLYTVLTVGWVWKGIGLADEDEQAAKGTLVAMGLAGMMAGLACGTKYTGVPAVLLAVPAAGCAAVMIAKIVRPGRVEMRRAMLGCVVAGACGLAVFSPWLARNYRWSGNAVFPMEMKRLGQDGFTSVQVERWERAHRAPDSQRAIGPRLRATWQTLITNWQYGYVVLPLGVIVAIVLWRRSVVWFLAILLLIELIYWMTLTHLQGRFAVQMVPLAAMIAGYGLSRAPLAATAVAVLAAATGLAGLHPCFSRHAEEARRGLFRLEDMGAFRSTQLARAIEQPGTKVALVGGGQAFFESLPMSRLKYRVIFNVDFEKGGNVLDAWLGQDIDTLRREGYVVVVQPGEIRRLAATYWQVPKLPPSWETASEELVVLMPMGK